MHPRSQAASVSPIGRLGRFAATHRRRVFIAWAVIAVGLGALAPRVETALSGAGWQANGSESVKVREQLDANFGGAGDDRGVAVAGDRGAGTGCDNAAHRGVGAA